LRDDSGRPLALTSHTLAPVPIAIGGSGLPPSVIFRDDLPEAGAKHLRLCTTLSIGCLGNPGL